MFYFDNFYGKKVLKTSLFGDIEHFFSTRDFILTAGSLADKQDVADENRLFLCEKLNIKKQNLLTVKQIHSDIIKIFDKTNGENSEADALISNVKDTAILLNFADCTPIILFDEKQKVAAVVHAGWRGTSQKILERTVQNLKKNFNSNPDHIIAAIGPAIGQCCFETGEDAFVQLIDDSTTNLCTKNSETGKYFIDLKALNKKQLLDNGVTKIDVCGYCTSCMSDIFFSYRKENGMTARHSAVIKI